LNKETFDLVVTDFMMPGMSAPDLVQFIKKMTGHAGHCCHKNRPF